MSVLEWFGIGVGCAAALWWWRYVVQRCIWEPNDDGAPHTRRKDGRPDAFEGLFWGTVIWALSPVWTPIYGAHKLYKNHHGLMVALGGKTNRTLLRAFPERPGPERRS